MGRRALHVLAALALVGVVAVVVRPPALDGGPPFNVERATPTPGAEPSPSPEVSPGTAATADPATADPLPAAVPAPGRGTLTIHEVDGRTLERRSGGVSVPVTPGFLHTELSPGGRLLAVATARSQPEPETYVRLFDTAALDGAPAELTIPAFVDRIAFQPDGGGLTWLESRRQGVQHVGGARLEGTGARWLARVRLPEGGRVHSMAPLAGGRAGLALLTPAAGDPQPGGVRLAVADLGTGELAAVTLPVVHREGAGGHRRTDLVPGVAWDVERDRAYVVHADRDAVLAVDLSEPGDPLELEAGRAAPPAGASAGVWRQVLLSGDGSMLYVGGTRSRPADAPATQLAEPRASHLPLLAAEAGERRVLDLGDAPRAALLAASPGGEHVAALTGALEPVPELVVQVLDGQTLGTRWQRELEGPAPPWARFGLGGSVLALAGPDLDRAPGPATTRVDLLESTSGERLATASYLGFLVDLHLDAGLLLVRSPD